VTTFQEVASKSESPQIDTEIPTPNSVGQANWVIELEVTSEDISDDSLPQDMDDTNSDLHSTDPKTPQIHAETEIERSLGQANSLIEVAETAADPSPSHTTSMGSAQTTRI